MPPEMLPLVSRLDCFIFPPWAIAIVIFVLLIILAIIIILLIKLLLYILVSRFLATFGATGFSLDLMHSGCCMGRMLIGHFTRRQSMNFVPADPSHECFCQPSSNPIDSIIVVNSLQQPFLYINYI